MKHFDNYKSLLKDTIAYLNTLEEKFIETKNLLFKVNPPKKKSILTSNTTKQQKKEALQPAKPVFQTGKIPSTTKIQPHQSLPPNNLIKVEAPKKEVQSPTTQNVIDNKKIKIEEKPQIIEEDFSDIKNVISKISTDIRISDKTLDDKTAKQKSQKYKLKNLSVNIAILAYKENEKHYKFLQKLSIALNNYFYPTKIFSAYFLEKENNWKMFLSENELLLILACDSTISELSNLRKHYRENTVTKEKFLDNTNLFLLPDISIYLKEPSLKISLFKTLQQKISNLKK